MHLSSFEAAAWVPSLPLLGPLLPLRAPSLRTLLTHCHQASLSGLVALSRVVRATEMFSSSGHHPTICFVHLLASTAVCEVWFIALPAPVRSITLATSHICFQLPCLGATAGRSVPVAHPHAD